MKKVKKKNPRPGRGGESDKIKIDARRQRVFEMKSKGLSSAIIAEALDVTTRTIEKDVAALRQDELDWLNKARKKFDADSYWLDRKKNVEMRIKEMWVGLSEQKTDRSAVSKEMRELYAELDMTLRAMGLITTKVDPDSLITDTIRIVHEHVNVEE